MGKTSEIKMTHNLFDKVVEAAPSAMIMIDEDGQILLANLQAEKLFGYTRQELLGSLIESLVPERYRGGHPGLRKHFFSAPKVRAMGAGRELFGRHKDGSEIPIEIGLNPLEVEGKTLVLASIIDITERKRADDRFRLAVEAAPNAMLMVDDQGKIVMANKQTEKLFAYDREQLLGRQIEVLVPARFRGHHPGLRSGFLKNPQVRSMGAGRDLYGVKSDGEEVPIEIGLTPVGSGKDMFVLASIIDITERKKNEQLISAREAALEASRLKSQFLANMSHEIRTPLNGIIGLTNLLSSTGLSDLQKEHLQGIQTSADGLLSIINDILDLSKIEADKMDLEIVNFSLSQMIADAISVIATSAKEKGLKIKYNIDPSLPHWFRGDVAKLKQVLINLLGNAVKFTPQGEIFVKAKQLDSSFSPYTVEFEVRDTGIGISEDVRGRLFEVFTQGDSSTRRKYGGTGLGLSISKKLVLKMGGSIDVESWLGQGTRFWIRLALEVGKEILPEKSENLSAINPDLKNLKILIAEDNVINQKVAIGTLKNLGLQGQAVGNGVEALEILTKFKFDLILMDCHMPELDGYEATQKIRAHQDLHIRNIPIIAMTANVMQGDRERCLRVGMNDYISKPLVQKDLDRVLSKWLPLPLNPTTSAMLSGEISPDPMTEQTILNLKKVYGLETAMDVIQTFVDSTPKSLDKMEQALADQDFERLMMESHALKSSSLIFGLISFSKQAAKIEDDCNNQQHNSLAKDIASLRKIFEDSRDLFKKVLAD